MSKLKLLFSLAIAAMLVHAQPSQADDKRDDGKKQVQSERERARERAKQRERERDRAANRAENRQKADNSQVAKRTRDACREEARDRNWAVVSTGVVQTSGRDGSMLMRLQRGNEERRADCRYDGSRNSASLAVRSGNDDRNGNRDRDGNRNRGGGVSADKARNDCVAEAYKQYPEGQLVDRGKVDRGSVSEVRIVMTDKGGVPMSLRCTVDSRTGAVNLRRG